MYIWYTVTLVLTLIIIIIIIIIINGFCRFIFTNKVTLWVASYSACVVYTKTIIHLSVGEELFIIIIIIIIIIQIIIFWIHPDF